MLTILLLNFHNDPEHIQYLFIISPHFHPVTHLILYSDLFTFVLPSDKLSVFDDRLFNFDTVDSKRLDVRFPARSRGSYQQFSFE